MMLLFQNFTHLIVLSQIVFCRFWWVYLGSFFQRLRRFWCDLALAVGGAAAVMDGGAALTKALVVSYLLHVVFCYITWKFRRYFNSYEIKDSF